MLMLGNIYADIEVLHIDVEDMETKQLVQMPFASITFIEGFRGL